MIAHAGRVLGASWISKMPKLIICIMVDNCENFTTLWAYPESISHMFVSEQEYTYTAVWIKSRLPWMIKMLTSTTEIIVNISGKQFNI